MIRVEAVGHERRRGVGAVSGAKGVVDVDVGVGGQRLGKLALLLFHLLLGGGLHLVRGVVSQAARLALLLGVEAEVLQQQRLTRLQGAGFKLGFLADAIAGKLHIDAKQLSHMRTDVPERKLVVVAFGPPQMRADDDAAPVAEDLLQRRQGGADARIVRNVEILVERDVEVDPHECLLTGKIK